MSLRTVGCLLVLGLFLLHGKAVRAMEEDLPSFRARSSLSTVCPEERKEEDGILTIPGIASGYEDQYARFLKASLIYKPDLRSDIGQVEIPVSSLANPLSGTFDLSALGDTGKFVSIHTGYKKDIMPANAGKAEIWICPKFLVLKELETTASYFGGDAFTWESPIVYFWTWGTIEPEGVRDGNMVESICMDNRLNLYEKWQIREATFLRNTRAQKLKASQFFYFKV